MSDPSTLDALAAVRPRPEPTPISRPFWDATAQGRFLIQRCRACSTAIFYPKVTCTSCGSVELGWEEASGQGTVHTFSVARRATHPKFTGKEPYVVAIVELAEGPRVTTNIVGCEPAAVHVGMAVHVHFEPVGADGFAMPVFAP